MPSHGAGEEVLTEPTGDLHRRPADILFPNGLDLRNRGPVAVDLAVTSGLQDKHFKHVFKDKLRPIEHYERKKCLDNDTQAKCTKVGLVFQPAIFEAHGGGWSGGATRVVNSIIRGQKARGIWAYEGVSNRVTQRLSTTLNREAARAILFRLNGARRQGGNHPVPVVVDSDSEWGDESSDEEEE